MLRREDCERYEKILHKEIAQRQALGGYNPDAGTIQFLCELAFELIRHVRESEQPEKPAPKVRKK